jgi:hypothetical protein
MLKFLTFCDFISSWFSVSLPLFPLKVVELVFFLSWKLSLMGEQFGFFFQTLLLFQTNVSKDEGTVESCWKLKAFCRAPLEKEATQPSSNTNPARLKFFFSLY